MRWIALDWLRIDFPMTQYLREAGGVFGISPICVDSDIRFGIKNARAAYQKRVALVPNPFSFLEHFLFPMVIPIVPFPFSDRLDPGRRTVTLSVTLISMVDEMRMALEPMKKRRWGNS